MMIFRLLILLLIPSLGFSLELNYESSTLKISNNKKDTIIYPLYISNIKNNKIDIVEDNCAYVNLKQGESCTVKLLVENKSIIKVYNIDGEEFYIPVLGYSNIQKEINEERIRINKNIKYYKLGLGNRYLFSYKTITRDLNLKMKNDITMKRSCFDAICEYSFSIIVDKESKLILNIDGEDFIVDFVLRKAKKLSIPSKLSELDSDYKSNIKSLYKSGYPKKEVVHRSLIKENKRMTNDESIQLELLINNNIKVDKKIIYYKVYPFEGDDVIIPNGKQVVLNLDDHSEYNDIVNNGKLVIKSKSNIALLGVNSLVNNGDIIIEQSNELKQESISFIYEKETYMRKNLKCEYNKKCLFIMTKRNIESTGRIIKNGIEIHSNFMNSRLGISNIEDELLEKVENKILVDYVEMTFFTTLFYLILFTFSVLTFQVLPPLLGFERINGGPLDMKKSMHQLLVAYFNITVGVIVAVFFVVQPLNEAGLLNIYYEISDYGWIWYLLSFPFSMLLFDFYFYVTHRALHTKWLYRKIHYIHHKAHDPTGGVVFYFHFIEQMVLVLFLPLALLIFPFHIHSIVFWSFTMSFLGAYGHSGYRIIPKKIAQHPILSKWIVFGPEHYHHHSSNKGFYALYFKIWDNVFKTGDPTYRETFDDKN